MTNLLASHVRILVIDRLQRLLLAKRQDPMSGRCVWEPPGGAIDPGESAAAAAERELLEETGIIAHISSHGWVPRHREYEWKGEQRIREELFYTVHVDMPTVRPQMPTEEERATFLEWRWVSRDELCDIDADLYPSDPFGIADS